MHREILPPQNFLASDKQSSHTQRQPSPFPAGLLFGYSVYTTFRLPLATNWVEKHLQRLENNAHHLGLQWSFPTGYLLQEIQEAYRPETPIIRLTAMADVDNYSDFYRSLPESATKHERSEPLANPLPMRLLLNLRAAPASIPPNKREGQHLKTVCYQRPLPQIKLGAMAESILLKQQARAEGFDDILFLNTHSHCTEASTSNFFIIENKDMSHRENNNTMGNISLRTPHPLRDGALPGITRLQIAKIAHQLGITLSDAHPISLEELQKADGAFLTNAAQGVSPVASINQQRLPWSRQATECLEELSRALFQLQTER